MIDAHTAWFRVGAFLFVSGALLLGEYKAPLLSLRNRYTANKANILLLLSGMVVARLLLPAGLYFFEKSGAWQMELISFDHPILTYLVFDFALYWQHRWTHEWPLLWRLHRVHHYDEELSLTTGLRFHPLEIGGSLLYKVALCVFFKFSPLGILIFEVVLNGSSLFTHANIRLPKVARRILEPFFFTIYQHRVHHSVETSQQRSNYGFILTLWDRLFKTYHPAILPEGVSIGVEGASPDKTQSIGSLLKSPFID